MSAQSALWPCVVIPLLLHTDTIPCCSLPLTASHFTSIRLAVIACPRHLRCTTNTRPAPYQRRISASLIRRHPKSLQYSLSPPLVHCTNDALIQNV